MQMTAFGVHYLALSNTELSEQEENVKYQRAFLI